MNIRGRLRREDGAAAVEFALIVGVLALLLFGMLQFGLAFFSLQNLRAAVREGARAGAVGASVDQVRQKVSDSSLDALPASDVIVVQHTDNGTTWNAGSCSAPASQTSDSAIRVSVDLNNPALPQSLQDIFVLNIPLMPQMSLKGADVMGEFRCEGVAAS